MKFIHYILIVLVLVLAGVGGYGVFFKGPEYRYDIQVTAVNGYDVVAYHTEKSPVAGLGANATHHNGVQYLFATKENMDLFKGDPGKYLPEFGGYCAMGVAMGIKLPIDPAAFSFKDGKLYLNLNPDIQKKFLKDLDGNLEKAYVNWKTIKGKSPESLKQ